MEKEIEQAVEAALLDAGVGECPFVVEWPTDLSFGDYATNVALVGAKTVGKNPVQFANELAPRIKEILGVVAESVVVAGPGFINITLVREVFSTALKEAVKEEWGVGDGDAGKRVMIEYTDPNPFKEMHIGHLMSNVIGESVARLSENAGAHVARANYFGDVGPHVAKALWALMKDGVTDPGSAKEIGKAYVHGSRAYEESEKAKKEIDALNVALYKGEDTALMELWRKGRAVSLDSFEEVYRTLDTKFDYYFPESEVSEDGMRLVREGVEKGVFEESEGAVIYRGETRGLHTLVFITSKGTPTYEAKELGLAFLKEVRWPSDKSLILTAAEQTGHFTVGLAALAEIAPTLAKKTKHIPHGFLRLTSGKMSSREGAVITAASFVEEVVESAKKRNEDFIIAKQVALGAIKYMILRQAPGGDIVFDPEKSLSLEGDSGPYLQYAYVRARSVLGQAGKKGNVEGVPVEPYLIERLIARFPRVARRAEIEHAPHHVAQYLTHLAGEWNSFYGANRIIGGEHESYKLLIAEAFANTMEKGLWLLGIPAPEKM